MSKTQLKHNLHLGGGFLPLLASLATNVLPALGVSALGALASKGVNKLTNVGLYLKKGGTVCKVETDGQGGLFLGPNRGRKVSLGDGLYVERKSQIYDGRGLLFGDNSPFKNVAISGLLL